MFKSMRHTRYFEFLLLCTLMVVTLFFLMLASIGYCAFGSDLSSYTAVQTLLHAIQSHGQVLSSFLWLQLIISCIVFVLVLTKYVAVCFPML